jgi:hypothetical protein
MIPPLFRGIDAFESTSATSCLDGSSFLISIFDIAVNSVAYLGIKGKKRMN